MYVFTLYFNRVKNDSGVRGRAFSETLAGWQKSCRQADSEILRLWYSRNNVGRTDEYIQSQHQPSARRLAS